MECTVIESVKEIVSIIKQTTNLKEISTEDEEKMLKLFSVLTKSSLLKGLNKSEDIPYDEKDYELTAERMLPYLNCYLRVLEELVCLHDGIRLLNPKTVEQILINSLFISSQFLNAESYWSNKECSSVSFQIIDALKLFSNCTNLIELFTGKVNADAHDYFHQFFPCGLLELFLSTFAKTITKKTWKNYPSCMDSYFWVLFSLKIPHIADYIPYFLPPALFMLDDWEQKHKVKAVKALNHILLNTPASTLQMYGRSKVIYEALKQNLYSRESSLLQVTYPAAILSASVLDRDPKNTSSFKIGKEGEVLDILLREMSHEERLTHRTIYAAALKLLVQSMGISVLRWSGTILSICSDYLETYESEMAQDRLTILEGLQIYIRHCWPRVHSHAEVILKMIVKLVYQISTDEPRVLQKELLLSQSKEVVKLLFAAAPLTVTRLCRGMEDSNISYKNTVLYVLSDVVDMKVERGLLATEDSGSGAMKIDVCD